MSQVEPQIPKKTVHICLMNLRMGGQLSSLISLSQALNNNNINSKIHFPNEINVDLSKNALEKYTQNYSFFRRMFHFAKILCFLYKKIRLTDNVLYILLPSPSFHWLSYMLFAIRSKVILSYEGPAYPNNFTLWKNSIKSSFTLVRMILNNQLWCYLPKLAGVKHHFADPTFANEMTQLGFKNVTCVSNFYMPTNWDDSGTLKVSLDQQFIWIGYIGHTNKEKGLETLILAFSNSVKKNPNLRLFLALSQDGNSKEVDEIIHKLNINKFIVRQNLVSISIILSQLDLLALPYLSHWTTTIYPSLIFEALYFRCPLLISKVRYFENLAQIHPHINLFSHNTQDSHQVESLEYSLVNLKKRSNLNVAHPTALFEDIIQKYLRMFKHPPS